MGALDIKLSAQDKRILRFASQSGNLGRARMTAEQIARDAECSEDYLYDRLNDTMFRTLFFETLRASLAVETPAILHKFVEAAKEGSFRHGKLILEIAGVYSEETSLNLKAEVGVAGSPFESDDEKAAFVKATFGKLLEDTTKDEG